MAKWQIFVLLKVVEGLALFFVPLEVGMLTQRVLSHDISNVCGIWALGLLFAFFGFAMIALALLIFYELVKANLNWAERWSK